MTYVTKFFGRWTVQTSDPAGAIGAKLRIGDQERALPIEQVNDVLAAATNAGAVLDDRRLGALAAVGIDATRGQDGRVRIAEPVSLVTYLTAQANTAPITQQVQRLDPAKPTFVAGRRN